MLFLTLCYLLLYFISYFQASLPAAGSKLIFKLASGPFDKVTNNEVIEYLRKQTSINSVGLKDEENAIYEAGYDQEVIGI